MIIRKVKIYLLVGLWLPQLLVQMETVKLNSVCGVNNYFDDKSITKLSTDILRSKLECASTCGSDPGCLGFVACKTGIAIICFMTKELNNITCTPEITNCSAYSVVCILKFQLLLSPCFKKNKDTYCNGLHLFLLLHHGILNFWDI